MKSYFAAKVVLVAFAALLATGCFEQETQAEAQPPQAPMAPTIDVSRVINETVTDWDMHTGRLQSSETVVLVPRVSGYIEKVNFEEGALVPAGAVLFEIDARPFQAEVSRLRAELRSAEAGKVLADKDFARAERLKRQGAVSDEQVDSRYSAKQQAVAKVFSVKAELQRAELDLEFTKVKAPISGRVSLAIETEGNYVTAGQTQLTTLVSMSRMYAYFNVDENTFLNYQKTWAVQSDKTDPIVFMSLANESDFPHAGYIDFVDNTVNQNTGTIRLRASFENDKGVLLPGLFTRLRMVASAPYNAILISQKAVGTDLNNKYVLVVSEENQVQYRPVQLGEKRNGLQVVLAGLGPDEMIVVNGLQRIFPNMTIQPNEVAMAEPEALASIREDSARLSVSKESTHQEIVQH